MSRGCSSRKGDIYRTEGAEIRICPRTWRAFDRMDEAARQDNTTRFDPLPICSHAPREPDHAFSRISQHASPEAAFLDLVIARDNRADPTQIPVTRAVTRRAKDQTCVRGVVTDRIEDV